MLSHATEAVNPQLLSHFLTERQQGRYNKDYAFPFDSNSFDEQSLISALLHLLQQDHLPVKQVLSYLIALKNLLERNPTLKQKKVFESTVNKILKRQEIDFDNVINNLSYFLAKRTASNFFDSTLQRDEDFFAYLEWLEDRLLFAKVINNEAYKNILTQLEVFKKESEISFFDKMFRYFNAFNTGLGLGSFFLSWGPMALAGLLGALGILIPPVGVTLVTVGFGLLGLGVGGTLIYKILKNYITEDHTLTSHVQTSEQAIYKLAHKEAALCKEHYCLNYKNLLYLSQVKNSDIEMPAHIIEHINTGDPLKNDTPQVDIGWRVTMSFFGTLGSVWGTASLICGLLGVSLLAGAAFSPAGLIVVACAAVVASAIAYKTYSYDRKTNRCQKKLDNINDQTKEIHQSILSEQKQIALLAAEKEALKLQIFTEQPENIKQLNSDFKIIERNDVPVVVNNIHTQPAVLNKSKYFASGFTLFSKFGLVKPVVDETPQQTVSPKQPSL